MDAKPDRRRKRTERWLADALISLTLEKGYEAVTIRDITERADVAYITFFRHFRAKEDLLMSMLDGFITEMDGADQANSRFPLDERPAAVWFHHILDHRDFLRAVFQAPPLRKIWMDRLSLAAKQSLEQLHPSRSGSYVPLELAANHIAASFLEFMDWWLAQPTPFTPEFMSRTFQQLVILPTLSMHFEE